VDFRASSSNDFQTIVLYDQIFLHTQYNLNNKSTCSTISAKFLCCFSVSYAINQISCNINKFLMVRFCRSRIPVASAVTAIEVWILACILLGKDKLLGYWPVFS
jgi:hypothetical protein